MIGVTWKETLYGSWHRLSAPSEEHRCVVELNIVMPKVTELLTNTTAEIHGRVSLATLATDREFKGTLGLGAIVRERRVPYAFTLIADDGRPYRFDGAKEVNLLKLPNSMTTLGAYIFDEQGEEVGRVVLRGDFRDEILEFLRSFRAILLK
jgi:hypothetical protein